jgi:hypothetical protein
VAVNCQFQPAESPAESVTKALTVCAPPFTGTVARKNQSGPVPPMLVGTATLSSSSW